MRNSTLLPLVLVLVLGGLGSARSEEPRGLHVGKVQGEDELASRRAALCIGINRYEGSTYGPLTCAAADARALGEALGKLGYDVTLMVDDDPELPGYLVPTYRNLDDQIHRFSRMSGCPEDTLIVSFAGHGDVIDGQSVLIPLDHHEEARVVTTGALFDALHRGEAAKKLLVLDACRSAKQEVGRLMSGGFLQSLGQAENMVVLSGCGANEFSYEDPELGHGRLTSTLIDALDGAAFGEKREFLFGHELWGYVVRIFHERGWAERQSPRLFGSWDARARFDLARREVEPPPPFSEADREIFDLTLGKARSAAEKHDFTAAVDYCGTALRIFPRHPDALVHRARAYGQLGYPDRAFQDAQAVVEMDRNHVHALALLAQGAKLRRDHNVARQDYTRAIQSFLDDPDRWTKGRSADTGFGLLRRLGDGLRSLHGNEALVREAYERVLATEDLPSEIRARALLGRGRLHRVKDRPAEALEDFSAMLALADAPPSVRSWGAFYRGVVYEDTGRREEAFDQYATAIAIEGASPEALAFTLARRGTLYAKMAREAEAMADFSRVLAMEGRSDEAIATAAANRGRFHYLAGRVTEAMTDLNRVIALADPRPESLTRALSGRGMLHLHCARFREAHIDLERAASLPGAPASALAPAHLACGGALEALGRAEEAAASYGRVLELDNPPRPLVARALQYTANALFHMGRDDDARKAIDKLLAWTWVPPDTKARALAVLGRMHAAASRPQPTIEAFERAFAYEDVLPGNRLVIWCEWVRAAKALAIPHGDPTALLGEDATHLATKSTRAWLDVFTAIGDGKWVDAVAVIEAKKPEPHPVYTRWVFPELANRADAPPELWVLYAWIRRSNGDEDLSPRPFTAYLRHHRGGPLADLAREALNGSR